MCYQSLGNKMGLGIFFGGYLKGAQLLSKNDMMFFLQQAARLKVASVC